MKLYLSFYLAGHLFSPNHWCAMSRIGTPYFDFGRFWYAARAITPCPFYDEPFPYGTRTGESLQPGQEVYIKDEAHVGLDYASCRTEHGWVNVWCRWNNQNEPVGVNFCSIYTSPKQ